MKALEKIIEAKENINMGYIEWAINCLDEAISEIEILQQPKSCFSCKFITPSITKKYRCNHCIRIAIDRYELKEQ